MKRRLDVSDDDDEEGADNAEGPTRKKGKFDKGCAECGKTPAWCVECLAPAILVKLEVLAELDARGLLENSLEDEQGLKRTRTKGYVVLLTVAFPHDRQIA